MLCGDRFSHTLLSSVARQPGIFFLVASCPFIFNSLEIDSVSLHYSYEATCNTMSLKFI